jgi:Cu2+-exporting ATPase
VRTESTAKDCIHCGLPIPPARRNRGDPFCCEGCLRVYELIRGAGLTRYYDLGGGSSTPAATLRPDSFAWLERLLALGPTGASGTFPTPDSGRSGHEGDARDAGEPASATDPSQPRRLTLDVQGIHCAACVWLLRELFLRRPGACDLRVNPALGQAELTWIPAQCDLRDYLAEAERFGYTFGPRAKDGSHRSRGLLVRLGICAAAAMNVMIFSLCFYAGLGPADGRLYAFFGQLNLGLTLAAVLVGGWVFFRAAFVGLRRGLVHLDLPIALGIALAFAGSVYAYRTGGPRAAYFDTVAIFVTLMLVGRFLQERVLERNRNSLLAWQGVGDLHARRVRNGTVEAIPALEIRRGDELWVVPGDLVPVESTLLSRPGEVSLDWITGESRGQTVAPGDTIPAGASNAGKTLLCLAAREDFDQSRLNSLLQGPQPGEADRIAGPGQRWWHRLGTMYVLGVLLLAALGFASWAGHDLRRAMMVTVSILVVTCPCAIGLATPLAHEMVHAALRRGGIFLRQGGFLERAVAIRRVVFDKTGTLTLARLVLRPDSREALRGLDARARAVLFAMTVRSNHPASRCLTDELRGPDTAGAVGTGATETEDDEVREFPGQGLQWRRERRLYRLGRRAFALEAGTRTGDEDAPGDDTCFAVDGHLLAGFSFLEEIRHDAAEEIRRLEEAGVEVRILSGDTAERTREVAAALGIPEGRFEGGLDPQAKADRVRELNRDDTMMVGDGLNDAPSFDAAFCTATPAVDRPALPARADLYYLGEGVGAVRRTILAAVELRRVVRSNLAFALLYNAAALGLCFAGLVSPLLAAVLMPLSSLSVVGHTVYRLSRRSPKWIS